MSNLIAKEDVYAPHPSARYGQVLIARKGKIVPKHLAALMIDSRKVHSDEAPAVVIDEPDAGKYDALNVKELAALVEERGLSAASKKKKDLIDALEDADEAGDAGEDVDEPAADDPELDEAGE